MYIIHYYVYLHFLHFKNYKLFNKKLKLKVVINLIINSLHHY
jgi:hypothetical protein